MQTFEYYPNLSAHIERMASTGSTGSVSEWSEFLHTLNACLDRETQLRAKIAELQALGQALPFPWCLDFIQPQ